MTRSYPEPRSALPTYGENLIASVPGSLMRCPVILTQPEPWAAVRDYFRGSEVQLHMVTGMEHARVSEHTESLGPATSIFGIGGGSALDHAKYAAWKTGLPLILVPSILSADAAFTKTIAVREGFRVRYVGEIYPDYLLIDYCLLRQAPIVLNRAGVGDLLSILTALWDWREAAVRLEERHDPAIARRARKLVDRLFKKVKHVRDVTVEGIHLLSESYREEVRLCEMVGTSRPEEGSEHHIAYCLEHRTHRRFLHGQLICLCVLIAGTYQGQDMSPVRRFLEELDLDCTARAVGTSREEIRDTLLSMAEYVSSEKELLPGVFHMRNPMTKREVEDFLDRIPEVRA